MDSEPSAVTEAAGGGAGAKAGSGSGSGAGVGWSLFTYAAQTAEGMTLEGTLRAASSEAARAGLEGAGLRLVSLQPAVSERAASRARMGGRALGATDFAAFNRQLAQLTGAGMPVSSGLRLIAEDVRRGRLSRAIHAVADEMENGLGLAEAFAKHRSAFPGLYAELVEAGVKTGRLPGVLLNVGQHVARVNRLKLAVWRAAAYPWVVLAMLMGVMVLVGGWIVPEFSAVYEDFGTELPWLTDWVVRASAWTLPAVGVVSGLAFGLPLVWWLMDWLGLAAGWREGVLLRLPLVGSAVSRSLLSRWCGLVGLGVEAGLDLPAALRLAGGASSSPGLARDAEGLAARLERGEWLTDERGFCPGLSVLPGSVPAAMRLASEQGGLDAMMGNLSAMYGQQAEMRLGTLQASLSPVLLVLLAMLIGTAVVALFLPLVKLMSSMM